MQRSARPNHFAIIDAWDSQASRDANASARHTRSFRSALEPLLYSPYDERPSTPIMGTGGLVMKAERVGSETLLARIVSYNFV